MAEEKFTITKREDLSAPHKLALDLAVTYHGYMTAVATQDWRGVRVWGDSLRRAQRAIGFEVTGNALILIMVAHADEQLNLNLPTKAEIEEVRTYRQRSREIDAGERPMPGVGSYSDHVDQMGGSPFIPIKGR